MATAPTPRQHLRNSNLLLTKAKIALATRSKLAGKSRSQRSFSFLRVSHPSPAWPGWPCPAWRKVGRVSTSIKTSSLPFGSCYYWSSWWGSSQTVSQPTNWLRSRKAWRLPRARVVEKTLLAQKRSNERPLLKSRARGRFSKFPEENTFILTLFYQRLDWLSCCKQHFYRF